MSAGVSIRVGCDFCSAYAVKGESIPPQSAGLFRAVAFTGAAATALAQEACETSPTGRHVVRLTERPAAPVVA